MKRHLLLFDLGGVLLDFAGPQRLCDLLKPEYTLADVRRLWPASPALQRFEIGAVSADQFARDFTAEWGVQMPPKRFLQAFSTWALGPLPGALSLLDELRGGDAVLACLTNMNAAYWERIRGDMGFGRRFDRCYASHEIGLLKPDARAYEYVLTDLGQAPEDVTFFDDTRENVEAAAKLGIHAYHTQGVDELRAAMSKALDSAPH